MYTIKELYDLDHTLAKEYLCGFEYPWEALKGIKDMIIALGKTLNKYEYDDVNNKYSIIRVDKELKPMRMPSKRADATRTFIKCDIRKDRWGRDVEAVMLDEEGKFSQTSSGIHRIVYDYDNKGNLVSSKYYDINGQLINIRISNEKL